MVSRRGPGQGSALEHEIRLGASTAVGPELNRLARRFGDRQLPVAIERHDLAVESDVDLDDPPGIAPVATAGWQLEDPPIELDRVVTGDLAAVLEDEGPIQIDLRREGPPGWSRVGRGHREAGVEAGQEGG